MAMGCSTNAVIHILAMARRAGQDIGLEHFDAASRKVPVIANIRPSGDKYLMEDFYYAGGLLGLMSRLKRHLDLTQVNASGEDLGRRASRARRSTTTTSSARSTMPSTRRARSRC